MLCNVKSEIELVATEKHGYSAFVIPNREVARSSEHGLPLLEEGVSLVMGKLPQLRVFLKGGAFQLSKGMHQLLLVFCLLHLASDLLQHGLKDACELKSLDEFAILIFFLPHQELNGLIAFVGHYARQHSFTLVVARKLNLGLRMPLSKLLPVLNGHPWRESQSLLVLAKFEHDLTVLLDVSTSQREFGRLLQPVLLLGVLGVE